MTDQFDVRDQRDPGWYWAHNEIIDIYGPIIGVYGLAVYHALAKFAGRKTYCWPSVKTIATQVGCSERKVRGTLRDLERVGLIAIEENDTPAKRQTSNTYYLLDIQGDPAPGAAPPGTRDQGDPAPGADLELNAFKKTKRKRRRRTRVPPNQKTFEVDEDATRFISGKYADEIEW